MHGLGVHAFGIVRQTVGVGEGHALGDVLSEALLLRREALRCHGLGRKGFSP